MESLYPVVRSRFKKHWKAIACQIHVVNCDENPKRGFLFDCGAIDVPKIVDVVEKLKREALVRKDIAVVKVKEDIFILNPQKFQHENSKFVVDVSGSLEKPKKIEDLKEIDRMLSAVREQLMASGISLITLNISDDCCVPTIFGYLINYPILYYHQPDDDANCLSLIDLEIHQVTTRSETLISFSVPREIFTNDIEMRTEIEKFLHYFQNNDNYQIKTFTANYPTIVL